MTLARRALLALSIALATAILVGALAAIDAGSRPQTIERFQRD